MKLFDDDKVPSKEKANKNDWWEESDSERLPPAEVAIEGNTKTVVGWKFNDDKEKVRVTSECRLVVTKMAESVALRRKLKKFGGEGEGMPPSSKATAYVDDVMMEFLHYDVCGSVDDEEGLRRSGGKSRAR